MFWPIRNTAWAKLRRKAAFAQCSLCRSCARGSPLAFSTCYAQAYGRLRTSKAGRDLRRSGGDRHRECTVVRRNPGEESAAGGGKPEQVAIPLKHEPRATNTAQ